MRSLNFLNHLLSAGSGRGRVFFYDLRASAYLDLDIAAKRQHLGASLSEPERGCLQCGTGYLNHPDHRAAGQATLDAIYPSARDRMTFPELLAEGLEPHKVREVYVGGTDGANIWIDVTDYFDVKVAALKAHASQIGDWDVAPMIREWSARTAQEHPGHGELAEGYRYLKLD